MQIMARCGHQPLGYLSEDPLCLSLVLYDFFLLNMFIIAF